MEAINNTSNASSFKNSFKWSVLIQLSFQIFGFAVSLILARILSPNDFGTVGIITIFLNITKKITDGGLSSSLIRSRKLNDRDFSTVFYFNLFSSVVLYCILYFAAPYIASFFKVSLLKNLIRVSGITMIIGALTTTQSVKLNKALNFKTQFKVLFPSLVISSIIAIVVSYSGYGIWSLVWKEIAFSSVAGILLYYHNRWLPSKVFDKGLFRKHFKYGYKLVITDLISTIFNDSYKAIIGKSFSISDLGYFTRAKSVEELPSQLIFNSVNRVLFPMLANVQDEDIKLKSVYRKTIMVVTFLVTPLLMLLFIMAEPLFSFLLTDKWLPAVPYFKILILGGMIAPFQPYLLNICRVKGRSDIVLKLSLLEYAFISLGMLSMIPYGISGLLWGLVISTFAKVLVAMYFAGKLINYTFKEQFFDLKDGFLLSFIGYLFLYIITTLTDINDLKPIVQVILISIFYYVFIGIICLLFRINSFTKLISIIRKNDSV